jgi:hypothetical protein
MGSSLRRRRGSDLKPGWRPPARARAPAPLAQRRDRILYRVVDEYNGDTLTAKRARSSKRPLSLGELIEFFLAAWPLPEVLEMNELDREGRQINRYTLPLLKKTEDVGSPSVAETDTSLCG